MYVYAIIATSQASVEPVKQAIESRFPSEHIRPGETCWLIADSENDVAKVSKKLGVKDQESGTLTDVLVIWTILFWGSLDPQVWAWINQKIALPIPAQK